MRVRRSHHHTLAAGVPERAAAAAQSLDCFELHLSLPRQLLRRAAASSLEASHIDSTFRSLSLRRQVTRGAFGDSTFCRSPSFARRDASTRERLSTSAACLLATRSQAATEPPRHRLDATERVARPLRPQPSLRGLQRASCVVCCLVNGAVERVMHMYT